jgi:hypothetical protein
MLDVLIPEQSFSSFGIEMVHLHSPTAPAIARKEAARAARIAYGKRKTRQVAATRVVRASRVPRRMILAPPDQQTRLHERLA